MQVPPRTRRIGVTDHPVQVRAGEVADLGQLTHIYNHYVVNSHATFDLTAFSVPARQRWFDQYATTGPHRLLVAASATDVLGYVTSSRFREKAAYATSVETTVYTRPEVAAQGIGSMLYVALFALLAGEEVHRALAGIVLPNDASLALHAKFGFSMVGTFREVGRKFDSWWDVCWLARDFS